jgi:hypothetical protein
LGIQGVSPDDLDLVCGLGCLTHSHPTD